MAKELSETRQANQNSMLLKDKPKVVRKPTLVSKGKFMFNSDARAAQG